MQLHSNSTPANLLLMDRLDLISTFTKIELWRQTQYSKIVYMDADVLALRAPDELLSLQEDFAAAPDIGWPDIFNSGVMVLRPNLQDYYALRTLAERGASFDGGDQGLLNTSFKRWHRLSFTYNCTPSGNYQYMPAYKHFESTISLIHFIGSQKPWTQSRYAFTSGTPYYQLLGRWWAQYDRHYRPLVSIPRVYYSNVSNQYSFSQHLYHPYQRVSPFNLNHRMVLALFLEVHLPIHRVGRRVQFPRRTYIRYISMKTPRKLEKTCMSYGARQFQMDFLTRLRHLLPFPLSLIRNRYTPHPLLRILEVITTHQSKHQQKSGVWFHSTSTVKSNRRFT